MKYCPNCGSEVEDNQELCANCAQADISSDTSTALAVDSATTDEANLTQKPEPQTIPKGFKTGITLLMLSSIVFVVCNALIYLFKNITTDYQAVAEEVLQILRQDYPELQGYLQHLKASDILDTIYFVQLNLVALRLVPLFWMLPMRKKILHAMKNGTKLSKVFKHCTWIFLNFFAGIILLGREDI